MFFIRALEIMCFMYSRELGNDWLKYRTIYKIQFQVNFINGHSIWEKMWRKNNVVGEGLELSEGVETVVFVSTSLLFYDQIAILMIINLASVLTIAQRQPL